MNKVRDAKRSCTTKQKIHLQEIFKSLGPVERKRLLDFAARLPKRKVNNG